MERRLRLRVSGLATMEFLVERNGKCQQYLHLDRNGFRPIELNLAGLKRAKVLRFVRLNCFKFCSDCSCVTRILANKRSSRVTGSLNV